MPRQTPARRDLPFLIPGRNGTLVRLGKRGWDSIFFNNDLVPQKLDDDDYQDHDDEHGDNDPKGAVPSHVQVVKLQG